jgi:hypothetical protein
MALGYSKGMAKRLDLVDDQFPEGLPRSVTQFSATNHGLPSMRIALRSWRAAG